MTRGKARALVVLGALSALMTATAPIVPAAERAWTRSDILAIADAEAKRLGYDIDRMGISFDVYNSRWNEMATNSAPDAAPADLLKRLGGRRYFAVYYSLMKEPMKGGDLFVFIDRSTSEVISTLQGK